MKYNKKSASDTFPDGADDIDLSNFGSVNPEDNSDLVDDEIESISQRDTTYDDSSTNNASNLLDQDDETINVGDDANDENLVDDFFNGGNNDELKTINIDASKINIILLMGFIEPSLYQLMKQSGLKYIDINVLQMTAYMNYINLLENKFYSEKEKEKLLTKQLFDLIETGDYKNVIIIRIIQAKYDINYLLQLFQPKNPNIIYINYDQNYLFQLVKTQKQNGRLISPASLLEFPIKKYFIKASSEDTKESDDVLYLSKASLDSYINDNKNYFESQKDANDFVKNILENNSDAVFKLNLKYSSVVKINIT